MKRYIVLVLCLWLGCGAYAQNGYEKELKKLSPAELQQEASGLRSAIENHKRQGQRTHNRIERALHEASVKEYEKRLKSVQSMIETQHAVDNLARSNAISAANAAQRAHYNHTEGRFIMEENAAASRERHRLIPRSGESARPVVRKNEETAFEPMSDNPDDMLAALDGAAPPFPTAGDYIGDFHKWKNTIAVDFKKTERGDYSDGTMRISLYPSTREIREVFRCNTKSLQPERPAADSVYYAKPDNELHLYSSLGQDWSSSDFTDEPIRVFWQPLPDARTPQANIAIVTDDPGELPSASDSVADQLPDVDTEYEQTLQLLQKKLNTYQRYGELLDMNESDFESLALCAAEDGAKAVVSFVDPYADVLSEAGAIVSGVDLPLAAMRDRALAGATEAGFDRIREKYGVAEMTIENPAADDVRGVRDALDAGEKALKLAPGGGLAEAAVTKTPLYRVFKVLPELGTGIGNGAAAVQVYFSTHKTQKERDQIGRQIQQLNVRLTDLKKQRQQQRSAAVSEKSLPAESGESVLRGGQKPRRRMRTAR